VAGGGGQDSLFQKEKSALLSVRGTKLYFPPGRKKVRKPVKNRLPGKKAGLFGGGGLYPKGEERGEGPTNRSWGQMLDPYRQKKRRPKKGGKKKSLGIMCKGNELNFWGRDCSIFREREGEGGEGERRLLSSGKAKKKKNFVGTWRTGRMLRPTCFAKKKAVGRASRKPSFISRGRKEYDPNDLALEKGKGAAYLNLEGYDVRRISTLFKKKDDNILTLSRKGRKGKTSIGKCKKEMVDHKQGGPILFSDKRKEGSSPSTFIQGRDSFKKRRRGCHLRRTLAIRSPRPNVLFRRQLCVTLSRKRKKGRGRRRPSFLWKGRRDWENER